MTRLTVAAAQMRTGPEKETNLAVVARLVGQASRAACDLIAFPEVMNVRGTKAVREGAEPIPGPTSALLADLARTYRIWIHGGSIPERDTPDAPRMYNTSILVSPKGEIVARYRKIHLFDVELSDGPRFRESDEFAPGSEIVTAPVNDVTVGLSVCYDLRFPELYRALAIRGAEIIFVAAAFSAFTGPPHWEVLLRARAIEHQAFVVAPAQIGGAGDAMPTHGHTLIIDPWGRIVAEAGADDELVSASLDLDELRRIRRELPSLANRRL